MKKKRNDIAQFIATKRKENHLTQEMFALRSGLSLKSIRSIEQGKVGCRMDTINKALEMFGCELGVVRMKRKEDIEI